MRCIALDTTLIGNVGGTSEIIYRIMRWVLGSLTITIIPFCWVLGFFLGHWANPSNLELDRTLYFSNSLPEKVALYSEDPKSNRIVAYLSNGQALKFRYRGDSGEWVYLTNSGRTVTPRDTPLVAGYQIPKVGFVERRIVRFLFYLAAFLLGLSLLIALKPQRKNNREKLQEVEHALQKERRLSYRLKANLVQQKRDHKSHIESLTIANQKKLELSKRKLEVEIRKESEQRKNATIEEMVASYSKLEKEYLQFREEAKLFGFDKDDPKYENLLKGRQFEIFVARSLVREADYKILEWTPDKGFDDHINVESNTNPDLVVQTPAGKQVAIECKYRSKTIQHREIRRKTISWSHPAQVNRYLKFQSTRGTGVYLAIGVEGQATKPEKNYFVSIDDLNKISRKTKMFKKEQVSVRLKDLYDFYVKYGQYGNFIQTQ